MLENKGRVGSLPVTDLKQSEAEPKAEQQDVRSSAKATPEQAAEAKALAYLKSQPGAPGTAAKKEFVVTDVNRDELGFTHVRVEQTYNGLKVFGGDMIVHLDKSGNVSSTTGKAVEIPKNFSTYPRISSDDAIKLAKENFDGKVTEKPTTELTIFPDKSGRPRLAYKVTLANFGIEDPRKTDFYISATSGRLISGVENIHTLAEEANLRIDAQKFVDSPLSKTGNTGIVPPYLREGAKVVGGSATPNQPPSQATTQAGQQESFSFNPFDWLKNLFNSIFGHKPTTSPVKGSGMTDSEGRIDLNEVKSSDGKYFLKDTERGGSQVFDANHANVSIPLFQHLGDPVSSSSADWADSNKTAVSAAYNTALVWDFYKDVLHRNSIDNKGYPLNSNIHVGTNFNNAFWNGSYMSYGDGDGNVLAPLVNGLDVAGHEITHGMTQNTAGLTNFGQSGALNEAMSDIFGTAIEFYAAKKNPNIKADYNIGETVFTPGKDGDALRYMDHPSKDAVLDQDGHVVKYIPNFLGQPSKIVKYGDPDYDSPKAFALQSIDNFSQYRDGLDVHFANGIVNNAFYLLAEGGANDTSKISVQGIGRDDAIKIYYRALTTYMVPSTDFKGAREATIRAANDLFGADSVQAQRVKDSWHAVGVE